MSGKKTSVAIIGGGISGLVCAARLSQLGITDSIVFDTGKHAPGGRCSSRFINIEGKLHIFDHAVQFFTVSDPRFAKIVSFLHSKGAVKVWPGKIVRLKLGEKPTEVQNVQAFIGTRGMQSVPECLSTLVNVEGNKWVSSVHWDPSMKKWRVDDHGWFDYLIVAHNGKCAARLMADAGAPQIHNLLKVKFGPVLSPQTSVMQLCSLWVLLFALPQKIEVDFDGAFVEHSDISWIGNNTSKYSAENQMPCWTIISSKTFGANHKVPQEFIPPSKEKEVINLLLNGFAEITGINRQRLVPCFTKVQLWGAANPLNVLQDEECVFQSSHNVGICGDWLVSPSVEGAAISGLALAEAINQHVNGTGKDVGLKKRLVPVECEAIGAFPTNKSLFFKSAK
ncbi:renalase-like [Dendropsophus ebraccatus]|uniref:renalase-like n=1 Tax=Dendropsophus ebraccatus TaxID=150705 RepID=UPI00383108F3